MKKTILSLTLLLAAHTAAIAGTDERTLQDEARDYACADVQHEGRNACLNSMFAEVQRTQKAFLKNPTTANAVVFDLAIGTFNGALAVTPRTQTVIELESQYRKLLLELANAQGKTIPTFGKLN